MRSMSSWATEELLYTDSEASKKKQLKKKQKKTQRLPAKKKKTKRDVQQAGHHRHTEDGSPGDGTSNSSFDATRFTSDAGSTTIHGIATRDDARLTYAAWDESPWDSWAPSPCRFLGVVCLECFS